MTKSGELVKLVEKETRRLKSRFVSSPAYWISPDNYVIPVGQTHIELIISNPEKFGLTPAYIKKVHKKHKEPIGVEGNARNQIMTDLVNQGWIRLRLHPREAVWVAQVPRLDRMTGKRIEGWAKEIVKKQPKSKNMAIQVVDLDADPIISYMEDIRLGEIARSSKKWNQYINTGGRLSIAQQFHEMVFVESINDFPVKNS